MDWKGRDQKLLQIAQMRVDPPQNGRGPVGSGFRGSQELGRVELHAGCVGRGREEAGMMAEFPPGLLDGVFPWTGEQ